MSDKKLTPWLVVWHDSNRPDRMHRNRVLLQEGYSTEADIPKILGIAKGIAPENVVVHRAVDVTDRIYRREFPTVPHPPVWPNYIDNPTD